jgi:hypothetical protein
VGYLKILIRESAGPALRRRDKKLTAAVKDALRNKKASNVLALKILRLERKYDEFALLISAKNNGWVAGQSVSPAR